MPSAWSGTARAMAYIMRSPQGVSPVVWSWLLLWTSAWLLSASGIYTPYHFTAAWSDLEHAKVAKHIVYAAFRFEAKTLKQPASDISVISTKTVIHMIA